jgi:SHS2 domain-containing protein
MTAEGKLFQEIDHTGDIGIEIDADSRPELFRRATIAVAQLMVETAGVRPVENRDLSVAGGNDEDLMHDLLSALLQLFLVDAFIWSEASVEQRDTSLKAVVSGEPFDPDRHEFRKELKAVTYHELSVRKVGDRWHARVVFDV